MTDLLDGVEPATLDEPAPLPYACTEPECQYRGSTPAALGSHKRHVHNIAGAGKNKRRDRAPTNINVTLGGAKGSRKDAELDRVRERAFQAANLIAGLVMVMGQPEDADDIQRASGQWADAVKALAVHEAWLRKIAAGGEASERAIAWIGFVVATLAMLLPILLRHKVLPPQVASLARTFVGMAPPVDEPVPDGAPVAA